MGTPAGLYKNYTYLSLSQDQVDSIDANQPEFGGIYLSQIIDQAFQVTLGEIPDNTITNAKLDPSVLKVATVTLTPSQINALHTTPRTLIAAPGAGKVIIIDKIITKLVFASTAFAGANAIETRYTDGSGAKVAADIPAAYLNSNGAGTYVECAPGVATAFAPVANAPVVAAVPVADPTNGDSPLVFQIYYKIVTL